MRAVRDSDAAEGQPPGDVPAGTAVDPRAETSQPPGVERSPGAPRPPGAMQPPGADANTALADLGAPAALVFDLDGTLVNTVELRIEAWLETFDEVGIPASRRHVAGLIGSDGRRLAREVAEVAGRTLDDARAEVIDRRAGEVYSRMNTDPQALPGAHDLLAHLQGGQLPWAIATSSRPDQVTRSLEALRLAEPPRVVDGSHVAHAKPAPDLLLLAAEQLDVPARHSWYVGDATWDMLAARAATMVAIGVPSGAVSAEALKGSGAAVVVGSLHELLAELRRRDAVPHTTWRSP